MEYKKARGVLIVSINLIVLFCAVILIANCESLRYVNQAPKVSQKNYDMIDEKILELDLAEIEVLKEVGSSAVIMDKRLHQNIIIAHVDDSTYVVASSHCPHRNMALKYEAAKDYFECSSIGSAKFKTTGAVIEGENEKPLKIYDFTIAGSKMTIRL